MARQVQTRVAAPKWPVDNPQRWPVAKLTPYANNPRTHSGAQVEQIMAAIKEFGWTTPVLIDEKGQIIAGHGRVMAAEKLGITEIPVLIAKGWTTAQKRAYVIADNQIPMNAGWDEQLLRVELTALAKLDFDINLVGFDDVRLATFMGGTPGTGDPDDAPEPAANAISRPGDVWQLGAHRLICGDSTDKATVEKVLDGAKPHLMVTDPPYGVDYDSVWRKNSKSIRSTGPNRAMGKVRNDHNADWTPAWALFPGEVAYVWHGTTKTHIVAASLEAEMFDLRAQVIWGKHRLVIGRGHYHSQHETCWYAVRKGGSGHWQGDRKQTTLWTIDAHQKSETGHSTQKPVECMKRPIENNSKPGDAIYEPFSGSGTTIIAAQMTGRVCLAIELNPTYVDLAVRRWEKFADQRATLAGTKQTFTQVEKDRGSKRKS